MKDWDEISGKTNAMQCVIVQSPVSYSATRSWNEYKNNDIQYLWFVINCVMLKIGTRDPEISYARLSTKPLPCSMYKVTCLMK